MSNVHFLRAFCFALLTSTLCFAARAAEPTAPKLPDARDKASLVEYQTRLTEWGNANAKDADAFWNATNALFYESTRALLECDDLTADERREYNEQFAGILGAYALREALDAKALAGAKLSELGQRAGQAAQEYASASDDGAREIAKSAYLAYARQLFSTRLQFALNQPSETRDELFVALVGDAITFALSVPEYGEDAYNIVMTIRSYSQELGEEAVDALCEAYEASENPKLVKPIAKLSGLRRYARLPGEELYFEALFQDETGEFVKKYDPAEYAGKPRLVEIWATWCGPCRKEIPRLKEVYERYHDAGFEILGYSVDQDVDALKKFLVDNEIPWKVASQKLSVEAGYRPLYEYYAINGVPEMILLDGDGKVIELDCRGVRLAKALQKLFPDVEPLDWDPATDFSARATDQNPDGN